MLNSPKSSQRIGFGPDGRPLPSDALRDVARGIAGNRLLLSFSGKDSLAAWLYLRDSGFELIPYFCYTIPHLSYDDQMLDYYENYFGTHIIRLPHPYLYNLLGNGAWQPPDTYAILASANLPSFDFSDIDSLLAKQFGLGDSFLCVVGMRAADNVERMRLIRQMGPIGLKKRRYYYAVWDWKFADVMTCIRSHGLKLSRQYRYFGSTGDMLEYYWLAFLRDHLPDDYRRVLELFPLADLELYRFERVA